MADQNITRQRLTGARQPPLSEISWTTLVVGPPDLNLLEPVEDGKSFVIVRNVSGGQRTVWMNGFANSQGRGAGIELGDAGDASSNDRLTLNNGEAGILGPLGREGATGAAAQAQVGCNGSGVEIAFYRID